MRAELLSDEQLLKEIEARAQCNNKKSLRAQIELNILIEEQIERNAVVPPSLCAV